MNILFTNVGRRTYLLEYALELKQNGYDINIYACDTSYDTAAMHVDTEITSFITPRVSLGETEYLDVLLKESIKRDIDVLIPLMDFELPVLSKNRNVFEKEGVKIWVSNYETITNCLDKKQNYSFCKQSNIPIPDSYFEFNNNIEPPIIKKRILGSGSVGLEIIDNKSQKSDFEEGRDMLQVFIEGKEYGMDIFNDYEGNYVHSCFREKILMRSGETDKAKTFYDKNLELQARKISSAFKHRGNMDIDFIQTKSGDIYFIDFNPRFGGGYPFTHLSGANYLKYIIDSSISKFPEKPVLKRNITGLKGIKVYTYDFNLTR